MRVLVTGASGFLGREACGQLRERGHDVSALVRRPGSEPEGTTAVAGDLADGAALTAAVAGAAPGCVVHLAAEIASQRDPAKIEEVNVGGTQRLIAACLALEPRPRVVFTSTVVTGDPHGERIDEETELPVETAYGRSKQEGERLLRESGLDVVILRPCHIYGPGGWYVEEFVSRLKQPGRFAVIGSGQNWWDMARVEDVAAAVCDCVEKAEPGSLYHVCDDEPIRMYDFVALTAKALGVGRPRRIPAAMARMVGGADAVLAVTRSARNSNAKIKRELGWAPRYPTSEVGVPDAIERLQAAEAGQG
jgi:nucleoside-diphosphate-sugar epimerase